MCVANGQRRGGRDEGEGRRRKNEIVAERCRHEEEKHFNSRCLSFNACSVSLCNSVLVSRCEWEWKKWEGNQSRPVSLGSAMFFVSSCCYRCFHRELCVVALRWTSEVMKRTFKVWLQKKKNKKKKKKTGLSPLNNFILSSSSLFVPALCLSAPRLTRPIYTVTSAAV